MKIRVTCQRARKDKMRTVGKPKKYKSAKAAADHCRGISADRVRIKVVLETHDDFDELVHSLPAIREVLSARPVQK